MVSRNFPSQRSIGTKHLLLPIGGGMQYHRISNHKLTRQPFSYTVAHSRGPSTTRHTTTQPCSNTTTQPLTHTAAPPPSCPATQPLTHPAAHPTQLPTYTAAHPPSCPPTRPLTHAAAQLSAGTPASDVCTLTFSRMDGIPGIHGHQFPIHVDHGRQTNKYHHSR